MRPRRCYAISVEILHERRLTLDYQPKIDLISGKVAGVEAQGYYIASALHGGDREAFLAALGKD